MPWNKHHESILRVRDVYVPEIRLTGKQPIALASMPPWFSDESWNYNKCDKRVILGMTTLLFVVFVIVIRGIFSYLLDHYESVCEANDLIGKNLVEKFNLCGYQNINTTDVTTMYDAVSMLVKAILGKEKERKEVSVKKKKKGFFRW
jgi:hypothetical protein